MNGARRKSTSRACGNNLRWFTLLFLFAASGAWGVPIFNPNPPTVPPIPSQVELGGTSSTNTPTYQYHNLFQPVDLSSTTGPVSASTYPPSCIVMPCGLQSITGDTGYASGYANSNGHVGASSWVTSLNSDSTWRATSGSIVQYGNSAVIESALDSNGNPILPLGTPVTLDMKLSLDGVLTNYFDPFGANTQSSDAEAYADLVLSDPTFTGLADPNLIDHINIAVLETQNQRNGGPISWQTSSSITSINPLTSGPADTTNSCDGNTQVCGNRNVYAYQSGVVELSVQEFIGDAILWNGTLQTISSTTGSGALATSDFSHTFTANLSAVTNNVVLDFQSPQASTGVPGPDSILLLAVGLLGMMQFSHKERRR